MTNSKYYLRLWPLLLLLLFGFFSLTAQEEEPPSRWGRFKALFERASESTQSAETPVNQPSVIEKYQGLYGYIHQEEQAFYEKLRADGVVDFDSYHNPVISRTPAGSGDTLYSGFNVFGWHPHWMGNAFESYRWPLLSHVSWFSYSLDPITGGNTAANQPVIDAWKETELIQLAQEQGCKVLITLTSHTVAGNKLFLDNRDNRWVNLRNNLVSLLQEKGANGVDLNFENLASGYEKKLSSFITYLSDELKKVDTTYLVTVVLPQQNIHNLYELERLNEKVDLFIITGYDYFARTDTTDRPVSPLFDKSSWWSIENSVFSYLESGIDRKKLLLGLPYYGTGWKSTSRRPRAGRNEFEDYYTYRETKQKLAEQPYEYDEERWSAFYWEDLEDTDSSGYRYRKIWFDDSLTLRTKYEWVRDMGLGGIGIWALGYDNPHPELWNLIETTFSREAAQRQLQASLSPGAFILQHQNLLLVFALFFLLFLVVGLVVSIFDGRVRDAFYNFQTSRLFYVVGLSFLAIGLYIIWLIAVGKIPEATNPTALVVLGLTVGILLVMVGHHYWRKRRARLP